MARRITRKRKTSLRATQYAAALAVMIVQKNSAGESLVTLFPLPQGIRFLSMLAAVWAAVWLLFIRLQLEAGWLAEDMADLASRLAGTWTAMAAGLALLCIVVRSLAWGLLPPVALMRL